MPNISDEALVERIKDGDQAAYGVLVSRHQDRFFGLAFRMMHDRSKAEDMLQNACVKLWQSADRYDASQGKFTTWFYRVVSNVCLDELRKRPFVGLPEGFDMRDDRPAADDLHAASDQARIIEAALAQLTERPKLIVTLCYYEGMTVADAAMIMDMNVKAAESLLYRTKAKLKNLLEDQKADLL